VKFNAGKTAAFLKQPDPSIRVVLIYGSDQGLIHERTQLLAKSIVEDVSDPFRVSELTGSEIKSDPARLIDEASAQSLIGGDRVVLIKLGGEDISKPLLQFLDEEVLSSSGSLVILEAGELTPRSPVRKLIEKSDCAGTMACYSDDLSALGALIDTVMRESQKTINSDAKSYLISNLGSDRMVSRSELEKLVTYAGDQVEIDLADAVAAVGDNGALSIDEIIYSVADGNRDSLEKNLARAFVEGTSPIAVLRAAIRHYQRLHLAFGQMQNGQSSAQAVKSLRPPIIFLFVDRFKRQLDRWSGDKIERALAVLTEAEVNCKSTGLPAEAICGRALMSLSQAARH
jgi:DNA polymerase-3 subunit delta